MRYLIISAVLLGVPFSSSAQHRPSLPSIGLPLPPIGLSPAYPPWERKTVPWWDRQRLPPWEGGHVAKPKSDRDGADRRDHDGRRGGYRRQKSTVGYGYGFGYPIYVVEPYVVEVPQPPQIIYVEVPRREEPPVEPPPPAEPLEPPPPYVPTGDRTVYVIPGCYVGNVSPVGVKLPTGCDARKVVTFTP